MGTPNARRRHFRRFFTPNEQHKPPSCLTRVSGTRARAPTARALAPAASASTRLVSSASTTSTCAVSASARRPWTLASPRYIHHEETTPYQRTESLTMSSLTVPLNDRNEICRGGTLGGGYSTAGK